MLGAARDGVLEYRYLDAVKLAGHSCPTVAGAWLMTRAALARLCPGPAPRADSAERETFAKVWQDWVRTLLVDHANNPELITMEN